jgi:A/G-specific adenine glycosylase
MEKSDFAARLLTWYAANARSLPWRGTSDPYAVLVSEFMLQQTRVETVIPYYERWMRLFPDIETLAGAPLDAVLKAWFEISFALQVIIPAWGRIRIAGWIFGILIRSNYCG